MQHNLLQKKIVLTFLTPSRGRGYVRGQEIRLHDVLNFIPINLTCKKRKLEDLTVLKHSPDLLNNVKIGQDQLRHVMKHISFYRGCGHFGQVT